MTTSEQYRAARGTLVSWLNWEGETDVGGLLLGLADYWWELRAIEDELGLPPTKLSDIIKWRRS